MMSTRSSPDITGTTQKNMHTNETPEMRLQTHSLGISTSKTEKAENLIHIKLGSNNK
jgi:hypothetical protein